MTTDPADLPLPVAITLDAALAALSRAPQTCRFHGDVPPAKPGPYTGRCDSCEQPARVRRALAYFRELRGEAPPARRYTVDTAAPAHRVTGGYRVVEVLGLWVPADTDKARALIERELADRGELGPFDVQVTFAGGPRG